MLKDLEVSGTGLVVQETVRMLGQVSTVFFNQLIGAALFCSLYSLIIVIDFVIFVLRMVCLGLSPRHPLTSTNLYSICDNLHSCTFIYIYLYIHTYIHIHTNLCSIKHRENESEALAQDD